MLSEQSTIAVGCYPLLDGVLWLLNDHLSSVAAAALSALALFVLTRAAGAIIGEYAKEAYFTRFKNERRKLKAEVDGLARHNKQIQSDIDYACAAIGRLREENDRLLVRAVQAEQMLRRIAEPT
ncbi:MULTISPECIES: hypothetical protein [Sphingomonas]|uniref:hypothetical protein n=1 Tax=Sphingomonas TaxID=13687 RepID=UPI0008373609|nr:hypothetical protein [Sphingomonas sp. CCH10-B3]